MKKSIFVFCFFLIYVSCNKKNDYQAALESEDLLNKIEEQLQEEKEKGTLTPEKETQLNDEWDKQFEKVKADYAYFYKNNINDSLGQAVFASSVWTRRLSFEQLEAILSNAGNEFKTGNLYKTYSERLHNMKTSVPGNLFKEIVSEDPNGRSAKLSDYAGKGKYVLLDFWASWCPPCREEMPRLVQLYNTYKNKNFEIVGYSLDRDEVAWKKGIEDLKISWPQMSDCRFWDSDAVKTYAVQSIPCIVLIDPEGKIIARGLVGEELSNTVRQLMEN
jgi:thiol-disulfide isomerase/thioredoxin